MERKTKYRILGVCIVILIIAAALPFVLGTNSSRVETALIPAPAFPEEPAQQTANMPADTAYPDSTVQTTTVEPSPVNETPQPDEGIDSDIAKSKNVTVPTLTPANEIKSAPDLSNSANNEIQPVQNNDEPISPKPKVEKNTIAVKSIERKKLPKIKLDDNGLITLKKSAWVVQIGSFKNKTNAIRLANKLRAKGYPAFIQHTSTLVGESTRVYVGPENKSSAARGIAKQIEQDFHLHGIVINYKPLIS